MFLSKNHKSHLFFNTPRLKIQFSAIYNFNWWDFPIHIQEQQLRALNTQNFFTVAVRQACHHRDTIKFSEFIFWNYQLFWKHVCFFFSFLIENLLIINTRKWQIISSDLKLFVNLSIFLFFNSSSTGLPATMTRNRCFSPQLFVINHQHWWLCILASFYQLQDVELNFQWVGPFFVQSNQFILSKLTLIIKKITSRVLLRWQLMKCQLFVIKSQ